MNGRAWILAVVFAAASISFAAHNESSFTPTSILVPVVGIYLTPADGGWTDIRNCYKDADGGFTGTKCTVDFADNLALESFFSNDLKVPPGVYRSMDLRNATTGGFTVKLKGCAVLGDAGTQYCTTAD